MNHYGITYTDMSYVTYQLIDAQYLQLVDGIKNGARCVIIEDVGLFILKDVRSIIKQIPLPEENESYTPDLSEEEKEHVKHMKWAEQMGIFEEEDETEYTGGMMP